MQVTFKGSPMQLQGNQPEVGASAPDFKLVDQGMAEVSLNDLGNEPIILNIVPSLDTPVCAKQSKTFFEYVSSKPVKLVTISMDLPFAQARFCNVENVQMTTLSDYKDGSFGKSYGLLVSGLHLLARSVIVLDNNKKIAYKEIVSELTNEPDYAAAQQAIENLLASKV